MEVSHFDYTGWFVTGYPESGGWVAAEMDFCIGSHINVSNFTSVNSQTTGVGLTNNSSCDITVHDMSTTNSSGVYIHQDPGITASRFTLTNNRIQMAPNQFWAGFELHNPGQVANSITISNNQIYAPGCSEPWGPIWGDYIDGAVITNNTITGQGGSAIYVEDRGNAGKNWVLKNNDLSGFNAFNSSILLGSATSNCMVQGNKIGTGGLAGIYSGGAGNQITNDNFMGNYPGWTSPYVDQYGNPIGAGCVLLAGSARNNVVNALKNGVDSFGHDVCNQVLDLPEYESSHVVVGDVSAVGAVPVPPEWGVGPTLPYIASTNVTEVDYSSIGSAGFADPNNPTSGRYFDRAPVEVLAVFWYEPDLGWYTPDLNGISGWILYPEEWGFPGFRMSANLVKTEATATEPAMINLYGFDIPNPAAKGVIGGLKGNNVPGYNKCLNKPAGFITAMQKKVAGLKANARGSRPLKNRPRGLGRFGEIKTIRQI